jgi:hypothetical protein
MSAVWLGLRRARDPVEAGGARERNKYFNLVYRRWSLVEIAGALVRGRCDLLGRCILDPYEGQMSKLRGRCQQGPSNPGLTQIPKLGNRARARARSVGILRRNKTRIFQQYFVLSA